VIGKGSKDKHEGVPRCYVGILGLIIISIKVRDFSYEESQKLYAADASYN